MKISSRVLGAIFAVAVIMSGVTGFLIGEKRGTKKGAFATASLAKLFLDTDKDFKLLLEANINGGKGANSDNEIRELTIMSLEAYLPSRALLAAEPFGQEPVSFKSTEKSIDDAIQRLKDNMSDSEKKRSEQDAAPQIRPRR